MKKIFVSCLLFVLAGCQEKTKKTVSITQIVNHPSLNQAKRGIVTHLSKEYEIVEQDAQGDIIVANQIANRLTASKSDLVVGISTPSAQALKNAKNKKKIPLLFCSVTYPKEAGLIENLDHPMDMTGVYDAPELRAILTLLKQTLPKIRSLGVIYNPGEANSAHTIKELEALAVNFGLAIKTVIVSNSNEVIPAIKSLVSKVDCIYIPSDNTVWPSLEGLTEVAKQHKIPVVSSDPDSVKRGVSLALGYLQYDLGVEIAHQIKEILDNKKPITQIKAKKPAKLTLYYNKANLETFDIKIPDQLTYLIKGW
jgi:putative ABC transport system substrate-binding protein